MFLRPKPTECAQVSRSTHNIFAPLYLEIVLSSTSDRHTHTYKYTKVTKSLLKLYSSYVSVLRSLSAEILDLRDVVLPDM